MKLPDYFLGKFQLIGTIAFSVLFAVAFLVIFFPFSSTVTQLGGSRLFLMTVIFFIIILILLTVSRVLMFYSKNLFRMTYLTYILWCLAEILIICVLYTFETILVLGPDNVSPSHALTNSFAYGATSLIIPYLISGMYLTIADKNRIIKELRYRRSVPLSSVAGKAEDMVSFYDIGGTLRFSIHASDLCYIESDDNYIKVWYVDAKDSVQCKMIRCRLKTVEEGFIGSSLVRCSRKHIVNTDKVKLLSKDGNGYFLDMGIEDVPRIYVSKTYQSGILSRFSEK